MILIINGTSSVKVVVAEKVDRRIGGMLSFKFVAISSFATLD